MGGESCTILRLRLMRKLAMCHIYTAHISPSVAHLTQGNKFGWMMLTCCLIYVDLLPNTYLSTPLAVRTKSIASVHSLTHMILPQILREDDVHFRDGCASMQIPFRIYIDSRENLHGCRGNLHGRRG